MAHDLRTLRRSRHCSYEARRHLRARLVRLGRCSFLPSCRDHIVLNTALPRDISTQLVRTTGIVGLGLFHRSCVRMPRMVSSQSIFDTNLCGRHYYTHGHHISPSFRRVKTSTNTWSGKRPRRHTDTSRAHGLGRHSRLLNMMFTPHTRASILTFTRYR